MPGGPQFCCPTSPSQLLPGFSLIACLLLVVLPIPTNRQVHPSPIVNLFLLRLLIVTTPWELRETFNLLGKLFVPDSNVVLLSLLSCGWHVLRDVVFVLASLLHL